MKTIIFALLLIMLQISLLAQENFFDERCNPITTVQPITANIDSVINHGNTLPHVEGSLPDGDYAIEINGFLTYINESGAIDITSLKVGDSICFTAFAHDLITLNDIIYHIYDNCTIGDGCDFPIDGLEEAAKAIVGGENDSVPGVQSLTELVDIVNYISPVPIKSVRGAHDILKATNYVIRTEYGLICYAGSAPVCGEYIGVSVPIELKSFVGLPNNCNVELMWETASEYNFSHFEVQKSYDGTDFHTVSRLESINGDNSNGDIYNYTDIGDIKSINYYRLRIVDKDYSFTYSNLIAVKSECTENDNFPMVNVYPNPVKGNSLFIQLVTPISADDVKIYITDQLGRLITEHNVNVTEGYNQLEIKVNTLNTRTVYFFKIQSSEWSISAKRFTKL